MDSGNKLAHYLQNPKKGAWARNKKQHQLKEEEGAADINFFGWFFYVIIGLIDGIMNGFPASTAMGDCNDHSIDIREYFEEGMDYYAEDDVDNGAA
jgi:hypothetical protein